MKTSAKNLTHLSRRSRWRGIGGALRAGVAAAAFVAAAWGGTYGKVVAIGGQASDIALDEGRGLLYIANFGANRIDVMNTSDLSIPRSINVNPLPGSIAISKDGRFLLVAHYGNYKPPASVDAALTLINLETNTRQTFSLSAAPLAVAFGADGLAMVVTTKDILLFDPVNGIIQTLDTHSSLNSKLLPVPVPDANGAPVLITESALGVSGDGKKIFGTTEAFGIAYDVPSRTLTVFGTKGAEPPFGPRSVSVNQDGSAFAFAWVMFNGNGGIEAEFSNPTGDFAVGGYAIDSAAGLVYMQVPDSVFPDAAPTLQVRSLDGLALRDRYLLSENITGKSVVSSNHTIYSISDSGVMVFETGAINSEHRLTTSVEDVVFRGAFCDRRTTTQQFTISNPGGGRTAFTLTPSKSGIRVNPSVGTTPAIITVTIDPNQFAAMRGTYSGSITISSQDAMNVPNPVRVLISTPEPDQKGTVVNVPGRLVDVLADPGRDRFYIIRQDQSAVLVFDGAKYTQIATLRTKLAPTQLAITRDGRNLLVAHENSATVSVYDLETLEQTAPIYFPYGHIPRSVAVAGGTILAAVHNRVVGGLNSAIDRIDIDARIGTELPSLGPYENKIPSYTVLASTPNGGSIMGVVANGSVFLYNSISDSFPVYRKVADALSGAYAASNNGRFVVDNNLMNASLVVSKKLETASGASSGFAFVDTTGLRATTPGASGSGILQRVDLTTGVGSKVTKTVESPIVPFPIVLPVTPAPGEPEPPPAPDPNVSPFTRSIAPLANRNAIILLTQSGFTVLPWDYDAVTNKPRVTKVSNTGDASQPLAGGGLISVFGTNLARVTLSTTQTPLPTVLGGTCVTVDDSVVPLFMVSPAQINGQLPSTVPTTGQLVVHTPDGASDPFKIETKGSAPSVIQVPVESGGGTVAAVYRVANNLPVTLTNPVHKGDRLIIYASGLGETNPPVADGQPAPSDPRAEVVNKPVVTLDGATCPVTFAGLAAGQVGVYQIEVNVPQGVQQGLQIPLTISQGGGESTVYVRVVQ